MRTVIGAIALALALTTGGAVARQALHLHDGPIVGWRCPECGVGNAGEPDRSFHAVCRRCAASHPWEEVVAVTGDPRL